MNNIALSYKDIVLQPEYSTLTSRSIANCKPVFLGRMFNSVAIPANMKCTIDFNMAELLAKKNYFYILHRFYDYDFIRSWVIKNYNVFPISLSVGVKDEDREFIKSLPDFIDFITIDIAHGHHVSVREMIEFIRKHKPLTKIIAGNIGTKKALYDLADWGADAAKIGLSMGKSCTTYNCTGVGTPMFSAVYNTCHDKDDEYVQPPIPIIADGQIREVGDVCKALVAGASMVMIGSEFAKCGDSPAETFDNKKVFFGSASSYNKGNNRYVEGQKVLLDIRQETYLDYYNRINDGVQSCMSYAGVYELRDLVQMKYAIHY